MRLFYQFIIDFIFLLSNIRFVLSGATEVTSSNINSILSSNELVFLNYYAKWCRFSQILNPIYDQLAEKIAKEYPKQGGIFLGKVDCDANKDIAIKYKIKRYPTLKLYRNGLMTKREYRGAREVNLLSDYLKKQIQSPIINISRPNDLLALDTKKCYVIGHFDNENSENYKTFSKVANLLRDDCYFVASTNIEEFQNERPIDDVVYSRSLKFSSNTSEYYAGLLNDEKSLYIWSNTRCIETVREITFENAEELTDEGLPFLILFHHPDDQQSIQLFKQQVDQQLIHLKSTVNCLHADGLKFVHPLQHLGKTIKDLPIIVIDTFKHMFLFPDFKQISIDEKLAEFVKNLNSGKLHQDFHNPSTTIKHIPSNDLLKDDKGSRPADSVFVRLSPSRQRYSFRDEL